MYVHPKVYIHTYTHSKRKFLLQRNSMYVHVMRLGSTLNCHLSVIKAATGIKHWTKESHRSNEETIILQGSKARAKHSRYEVK